MFRSLHFATLALAGLATIGCSDDATSPDGAAGTTQLVAPALKSALDSTLIDEWHAEASYAAVLRDFGAVLPFANIIRAEQRHAASLLNIYVTRGLTVPANPYATVPAGYGSFASVAAACAAGVEAEIANIALYDRALALGPPTDIQFVWESNRRASLEQHLPAFTLCR